MKKMKLVYENRKLGKTGLTVNERLYISGLLNDFDEAVKEKAEEKIISILKQVNLTEDSILPILKEFGLKN
jgi:molecular chaperone GrpE (heat shock protein)